MKFVRLFLVGLLCASTIFYCSDKDEFIVKKKKNQPSLSTLKDDCTQLCADHLQLFGQIFKKIAHLNTVLLEESFKIINQETHSIFVKGDKQTLQGCSKKMSEFKDELEAFNAKLDTYLQFFNQLN